MIGISCLFCLYGWHVLKRQKIADTYPLKANFVFIGALTPRSDVDMNGVKIGNVTSIQLNKEDATATVYFTVDKRLKLPTDSLLTISHATPLSDDALYIEPGKSSTYVKPQETLKKTQEPVALEQQISNYIFGINTL